MRKIVKFFQEVRVELKKVGWPGRQELIKLTLVVIFVTIIVSLYIGGLDLIFAKLMGILIK